MAQGTKTSTALIGIDPAPSKAAAVWSAGGLRRVAATDLPAFVADLVRAHEMLLIAWDAPLSFDPRRSMSDRPIDRAVRRWCKQLERDGSIAPKAVSVLPFSGCPHWAITCATLGVPFGSRPGGLVLVASPGEASQGVVEVHPAVAMAMRWRDLGLVEPFPRYKGDPAACRRIAAALAFPESASTDDDALDAYVAHWLAQGFVEGTATSLGDPFAGSYVVPCGPSFEALRAVVGP